MHRMFITFVLFDIFSEMLLLGNEYDLVYVFIRGKVLNLLAYLKCYFFQREYIVVIVVVIKSSVAGIMNSNETSNKQRL